MTHLEDQFILITELHCKSVLIACAAMCVPYSEGRFHVHSVINVKLSLGYGWVKRCYTQIYPFALHLNRS